MAIENRELTPGTQLTARFKKEGHACAIEQGADGKLAFVLADGRRFTSPSAAGSAVMGGTACNGWRFWSLARDEHLATPVKPAKASKQPKATRGGKLIKRLTGPKEGEPGMVAYFCASCLDTFIVPAGEQPNTCPKGHAAIDESEVAATTA